MIQICRSFKEQISEMALPGATMSALEKISTGIRRSRRNLIKVGAIGGSAIFANLTTARLAAAGTGGGQGGDSQGGDNNSQGGDGHRHAQCFLKGTKIQTAKGDRKIEDLVAGDLLPTVFGGISLIQWIARYSLRRSNPAGAWLKKALPVRIARSAVGRDVPRADLYVTKRHALLIDGVLVTAGSLINGTTITVYDPGELDELEFFNIKLARHDAIYAEGAPCETMLTVEKSAVNFDEYLRRFGRPTTQEPRCAPLLSYDDARSKINSRFRSAISPWVDRRQKLDIIRDELEERGIAGWRGRSSYRASRTSA